MPTKQGQELLNEINRKAAEDASVKQHEGQADASLWAIERVKTLKIELKTKGLGDLVTILELQSRKTPSPTESLKIDELNKLLGIELRSKMKINNARRDPREPNEWRYEILVSDLLTLLEQS